MNQGYYTQPTLSKTHIAFISDDDLWLVERAGGEARRLTAHRGFVGSPSFSPDGKWLVYLSSEGGTEWDVYLMPSLGGEVKRLTWFGVQRVSGWKDNKHVYFISSTEGFQRRETFVYELNIETLDFTRLDLGPASYYCDAGKFKILARHSADSARWKRYQGGTAGVIWSKQGSKKFQRILKNIKTNLTKPEVIKNRIYFISDHEGVGNVYSCLSDGSDQKRHTHHLEYYCRNLRSNGEHLVYQCGAEIFVFNTASGEETHVNISCKTIAVQAMSRYENWAQYFDGAVASNSGLEVSLISRGHLFQFQAFSGPVKQLEQSGDVRFVSPAYTYDSKYLIAATSTSESDEKLIQFSSENKSSKIIFSQMNWGKIWDIKCSPKSELVAVINNRNQIFVLDLKKKKVMEIEKNQFNRPDGLDWSPDGRYLAYTASFTSRTDGIRIWDSHTLKCHDLITPVNRDFSPSFDPEGKYLMFIGVREFSPNYNETHFDLGFPFATRPYLVVLNSDTPNPFETNLMNPIAVSEDDQTKLSKKKKPKEEVKVQIDFENINTRIKAFPSDLGGFESIVAIKGGALYLKRDIKPLTQHPRYGNSQMPRLMSYRFEDAKEEVFHADVNYYSKTTNKEHLLIFTKEKLRLVETKIKPNDEKNAGKKSGFVDMSRVKLKIDPLVEWKHVYREAWVLQHEHFWRKDMSKIDWKLVYTRYLKLLAKVKTRSEFSDLMWEMQGELGTSHCYEMMGDYNRVSAPVVHSRFAAGFKWNEKSKTQVVTYVFDGDSWTADMESPFSNVGVKLRIGDSILAVDGVTFETAADLYRLTENKAEIKVELLVNRKNSSKTEVLVVKPSRSNLGPMYRDWVEKNKKYVHKVSRGKLGYVHIPDMGPLGYAEFYRNYVVESDYEGVVVDVRFNGGGHVSQHLLKVLAQKVLGFDETRYQGKLKYPMYAPGVLVALCNEYSGSDGDIFPHSFKLMKLGKLIGKRTWGGVIGINGQYRLRDGTWVTQPEYSYWFKDNEWMVENYGVDPDIEVEITPEDYQNRRDPQLDVALAEALKELKRNPNPKFKPSYYPDLSLPQKLQKLNR